MTDVRKRRVVVQFCAYVRPRALAQGLQNLVGCGYQSVLSCRSQLRITWKSSSYWALPLFLFTLNSRSTISLPCESPHSTRTLRLMISNCDPNAASFILSFSMTFFVGSHALTRNAKSIPKNQQTRFSTREMLETPSDMH